MIFPVYHLNTAPASEPVTTAEAKTHLRITGSDDDTYIDSLIKAARMMAEQITNRAIISQTWEAYSDEFPDSGNDYKFALSKCPVSSISKIEYYDSDNSLQTLDSSYYEAFTEAEPAIVRLAYNKSWPSTYDRQKAVIITFITGWANAAAVPEPVKQAILIMLAHMYENRQDVVTGMSVNEVPMTSKYLLQPYRILRLDA